MSSGLGMIILMGVLLKIPLAFACWLIWYAIKSEPDVAEAPEEDDGGQRRRFRRQPKRPGGPRRGPHAPGAAPLPCPEESGGLRVPRPAIARPLTAHHERDHRSSQP